MSKTNQREQKMRYIFAQHPKTSEFHVTSDDQAFVNPSDAKNHATSLEDQEIVVEKRGDYVKTKVVPTNQEESKKDALFKRHEELFGQKPAWNANLEKLEAKIVAEEAKVQEVNNPPAEDNQDPKPPVEDTTDASGEGIQAPNV